MEKYIIEETNNNLAWDKFLLSSENKNIYCHSTFLNLSKNIVRKFFIKKGNEIFAAFILLIDKKNIIRDSNLIYTPLIFHAQKNMPIASFINEKYEIIEIYKDFILRSFNEIDIYFDHHLDDLRPFLWHNLKDKKHFLVSDVRFTSLLDLEDLDINLDFDDTKFYKNCSVRIRQQYKYSITRKKYKFKKNFDIKIFKQLIIKTFKRQNLSPDFQLKNISSVLQDLNNKNIINMYYNVENNEIKSFAIFGKITNNAIYLFGGRNFNNKDDYSLTNTLIKSFYDLRKENVKTIDLEGINSPNRGFYKLGFGGKIVPYYNITRI
jgi:hypothetical protein